MNSTLGDSCAAILNICKTWVTQFPRTLSRLRPYDDADEEVEGEEGPDDDEQHVVEVVVHLNI